MGQSDTELRVKPAQMEQAVSQGVISAQQAQALRELWQRPGGPSFTMNNALYYLGAMIAISAMSLFMVLSYDVFGPWGLFALSLAGILGLFAASRALLRRQLPIPAGALGALAVTLTPLAAWCVQKALGLWPEGVMPPGFSAYHQWIDWRWISLELVTLLVGAVALRWLALPFMVMPVAVTVWYLSMDFARLGLPLSNREMSVVFGLCALALAMWVDTRSRLKKDPRDFAFWLYIFGCLTFWGALSLSDSASQLAKLGYCLINAGMIFFGAMIGRRVFAVCGSLGVALYLGQLSYAVFKDSLIFPFALMALGLAMVMAGVWWQRHETLIQKSVARWAPKALRALGDR